MGPASKDTYIEINSDEVKKDEENTKEEMDEALREGLRRSMRHTKGSRSPEPDGGAQSSDWQGNSKAFPTSPTKKARVRFEEEDGQGGEGFGTPAGSATPEAPAASPDKIEETARHFPAFAAEAPRAPEGEEGEVADEGMGVNQEEEVLGIAGQAAAAEVPKVPAPATAPSNDQFLMQINANMETLQLMIGSMKNLQVNTDAKLENTKEEIKSNLKKSEEKQQNHMNDMQKKIEDNVQKDIKNPAGRLEDLEKNTDRKSPRSRMPATPPHSHQGEDPRHAREGLKDFKPRQRDPWARPSPSPTAPSLFTPKKNPLSDAGFAPNAIFLKGWGQYGSRRGLPMGEAQAVGLQLKGKLLQRLQEKIASIQAPYFMNHRIRVKMKSSGEDCWAVGNALADELKARPMKAMGKNIYGQFPL